MSASQSHNLRVVHHSPGRLRVNVPEVKGNKKFLGYLTAQIKQLPGVLDVTGSTITGRILILYTPLLNTTKNVDKTVEPEDLPLNRQIFNVALGGAVLTAIAGKRSLHGPSALADSPRLFNIAAMATIISGYPILRSGVQNIASRGRINYDLVMGLLSLSTLILRESVPGLLVVWLVNLNSLLQTIVLAKSRAAAISMSSATDVVSDVAKEVENDEKNYFNAIGSLEDTEELPPQVSTADEAERYAEKIIPISLGLAGVTSLVTGDPNKGLAALLAGSPGPAGLAAPTALSSGLAAAYRKEIMINSPTTISKLECIDTLYFNEIDPLLAQLKIEHYYSLTVESKAELIEDSLSLLAGARHPLINILCRQEMSNQGKYREFKDINMSPDGVSGFIDGNFVAAGSETFMRSLNINTNCGALKAKRISMTRGVPLFVARENILSGVLGLRWHINPDYTRSVYRLRAKGIMQLILLSEMPAAFAGQLAEELGINLKGGLNSKDKLFFINHERNKGKIVALVGSNCLSTAMLFQKTDVSIAFANGNQTVPGADILLLKSDPELLAEIFTTVLSISQRRRQNIALAAAMNALGLTLATSGRLLPVKASVFNNLISIAISLNSFRMLLQRKSLNIIRM